MAIADGEAKESLTSAKGIKFPARFAYLEAIEEHWPQVLSSLGEGVFDNYRRCLQAMPKMEVALGDWPHLKAALQTAPSEPLNALANALYKWLEEHGFRNDWILDAAVQTMYFWAHGDSRKWMYRPRELKPLRFHPRFGIWMPVFTTWAKFKMETHAIYRKELVQYRRARQKGVAELREI